VKLFHPVMPQRMKRSVCTAAAPSLKKNCQLSQFPECPRVLWVKPAAGGMKDATARPGENAARNSIFSPETDCIIIENRGTGILHAVACFQRFCQE
jgi:hypothetical protein